MASQIQITKRMPPDTAQEHNGFQGRVVLDFSLDKQGGSNGSALCAEEAQLSLPSKSPILLSGAVLFESEDMHAQASIAVPDASEEALAEVFALAQKIKDRGGEECSVIVSLSGDALDEILVKRSQGNERIVNALAEKLHDLDSDGHKKTSGAKSRFEHLRVSLPEKRREEG